MIDVGDVAIWLDALYDTQAALKTATPGKIWMDSAPQSALRPFGVYTINRGNRESYSYGAKYQFRVDLVMYCPKTGSDIQSIRRLTNEMMNPDGKPIPSYRTIRNGKVLTVTPASEKLGSEMPMIEANDYIVIRTSWNVTVMGI